MTTTLLPRKTMYLDADLFEADFRKWKGDPSIGWAIVTAKQHVEVLYQEFHKGYASIMHEIIAQIFEARSDPKTALGNERVREAWAKLPEAIRVANAASEYLMLAYAPSDSKTTKFLFHSEHVLHSLVEAEHLLEK